MRTIFISTTLAFWILIGGLWASSIWMPVAAGAPTQRVISPAELARHARPDDCWMAIRGSVYDLTAYLPDHPSRPEIIERWCGKEATKAYDTKTKSRPHSAAADKLLPAYRIGTFAAP
jgi:cytochrome b involved in lipid metabolism